MSRPLLAIVFGFLLARCSAADPASIDFQRDVKPILAEHCYQCHGADATDRKGGLQLDQRTGAIKGGESGSAAIVPGKTDKGELLARIFSTDESELMPPPSEKKPLSAKQRETLKQWIAEGAPYEVHWAFRAPQKEPLPQVGATHPVDAWVYSNLRKKNIEPAKEADQAALCRRVYLDLIGLPPSPQELKEFAEQGYEATVDKLMASERFGEKWARHWLDAARYSDTNGYEKDLQREQWAWRDWVISALNRDMPYNQFLLEQVAGDLLPNATQDQIIATGFLRNSMINEEGAIVPEQFRMVEMFDRMDCLGKAVLGLSTQCAQCHNHKFDPLTQNDYYAMFAFFNNTYEAQSWIYTPEQLKQIGEIRAKVLEAEKRLQAARPEWQKELTAWGDKVNAEQPKWEPLIATLLETISGLNHPTQEADRSILMKGHVSSDVFLLATPKLDGVTGLRIEALPHRDLPNSGPGRNRSGTFDLQEVEAFVKAPGGKDWTKVKLANATADFSQPLNKQADGKRATGPVSHLIDGSNETTWNVDRGNGRRNQASVAVIQFDPPLTYPEGTELKIAWRNNEMLGCARFSITRNPAPAAPPIDHAAILALGAPAGERSADQHAAIFAAWRAALPEAKPFNDEIAALLNSLPQAGTSILHLAERSPREPRSTHLLNRGDWDKPLAEVQPQVPAGFHPLPADAPKNRLGFGRWLVDPKSPLTARVAVNRAWQVIFGMGLVETAEDFGTRAPAPEYRELLDWLAADFMEQGWSQKKLIRTIVTSRIYKQSSQGSKESWERDPKNVLLARGPRFRAEAEVVRDIVLAASGLLTNKLSGPSFIPPVPQNVLDYNFTYPGYWKPAEGPDRYRRTVYMFRKRSMPDPVMSNFDAPNSDFACARRIRSNTPLAALTSLNEPIFNEAARGLAFRVLREGGASDDKRADYAFVLCTSRLPTPAEREALLSLLQSRRKKLGDGWLNMREILTGDPNKLPALPENTTPQDAAAWTLVSRVLLNLDETISKN